MKTITQHPSALISNEDFQIIRNTAADAEKASLLHPDQLAIIYREKWFKLLVPNVYAGLQITLPELVRLQEAISWADGSTGWVVTLCSGAGWFGGFIDPEAAKLLFNNPTVCLAGSGAVGGTATLTPNGYIINGRWKYASGIHHATHITANCTVIKDGNAVIDAAGNDLVLPFVVDKKDVTLLPAWKYIGMMATGSDAFEITNLLVDFNRQFKIEPSAVQVDAPLYKYPFLQLAEATLAVNLSGIAIHFIDLCDEIFPEKAKQPRLSEQQKAFMLNELATVKTDLDELRTMFFEAVDESWLAIEATPAIPHELLSNVSASSRSLAKFAREGVDRLYPFCGLLAASPDTEINRAWRDLHTASQHSLLTFSK